MSADAAAQALNDRGQAQSFLYDAFISYDHDDRPVALGIQRGLHRRDIASGRQLGEPVDTTAMGDISNVEFGRDGRRVFVTATGRSLEGRPPYGGGIWQLPAPAAWADALCDKLKSNPTHEQWEDWISRDIPYQEVCSGKG